MKKLFGLLLLVFFMAGCGGEPETKNELIHYAVTESSCNCTNSLCECAIDLCGGPTKIMTLEISSNSAMVYDIVELTFRNLGSAPTAKECLVSSAGMYFGICHEGDKVIFEKKGWPLLAKDQYPAAKVSLRAAPAADAQKGESIQYRWEEIKITDISLKEYIIKPNLLSEKYLIKDGNCPAD